MWALFGPHQHYPALNAETALDFQFHLPHAMGVRLHGDMPCVVILDPETATSIGVKAVVFPCM